MRILLAAEGFSAARPQDAGRWLGELAVRLTHRGHRVTAVLSRVDEDDSAADPPGVAVWRPGTESADALLRRALDQRPDVVHLAAPGPWSEPTLRALADAPLVLDALDFWPLCAAGDLVRRPRLEACPHQHGFEGCGECAGHSHVRAMEARAPLGREARVVIAHTAAARDRLEAGLRRAVDCIRPGLDPLVFSPSPEAPQAPEIAALLRTPRPPRVLVLGDGGPHRGAPSLADLLVALHARVPGVELVILSDGDPDDAPPLVLAEARELGLAAQVLAVRDLAREDEPALVAACDVACVPGPLAPTGGLRVMEALSAGLPVVAHAGGAIGELVTHGAEGVLVPADPIGGFAHAVAALLRDPVARAEYAGRARLAALERFDVDRAVYAHEEVYLRARRRPRRPDTEGQQAA